MWREKDATFDARHFCEVTLRERLPPDQASDMEVWIIAESIIGIELLLVRGEINMDS